MTETCPKCGSALYIRYDTADKKWYAACRKCNIQTMGHTQRKKALEALNKRILARHITL